MPESNGVHADAREAENDGGYWVVPSTRGKYHADRDCFHIQKATKEPRQLPPGETPLRGDPCKACIDVHEDAETEGGVADAD